MSDDFKKDDSDHYDAEKTPIETFHSQHPPMDPERRKVVEKSMKRKLDARCSLFILIYIMNYLDRNNMAAARLKGLQEDLKLSDTQYATCLSILYVGYILMQVCFMTSSNKM
jgi:sugar phosphate permease